MTNPSKLPSIPVKTSKMHSIPVKTSKMHSIHFFLKIGILLKYYQTPFDPSSTVTKPLRVPFISVKTRKSRPFRSQKCKKYWKTYLGDFYLILKIGGF